MTDDPLRDELARQLDALRAKGWTWERGDLDSGDLADALLPAIRAAEPQHEWQCPSCGATTRARMADRSTT